MVNVLINNLSKQIKRTNIDLVILLNILIDNRDKQIKHWTSYSAQCFNW